MSALSSDWVAITSAAIFASRERWRSNAWASETMVDSIVLVPLKPDAASSAGAVSGNVTAMLVPAGIAA